MKTLISGQGSRLLATLLSGLLVAMATLFSTAAMAQDNFVITGSPHDFSSAGWNTTTEICVVCHTPHNTISPTEGPLWNRVTTGATYTLYNFTPGAVPGSDIDGTGFGQPTGVSRLCLSCHDGTIAIDSFGRDAAGLPIALTTTGTYVNDINANANIGGGTPQGTTGDLSNDHPVAFTFPAPGADLEIVPAAGGLPLFGVGFDQLECATCHDVHASGTWGPLLRVDNTGSGLCLTCHSK